MRMILTTALLGTMLIAAPESQSASDTRPTDLLERPFVANGRISMDLSAGEYQITGSDEPVIRLEWSARDPEKLSRIEAQADVRGRDAAIETDGPDNSGLKVSLRVPARADLYIRLTAGELTIKGIEGNKDVALHAGELSIDIGRAENYSRVKASVWAGEVDAPPYQVNRGGLFRSFDWRGTGPYQLEARLKAGELRLYSNARN